MEQRKLLPEYPFKVNLKKVIQTKICGHCGKVIATGGKILNVTVGTNIIPVDVHDNAPSCADITFLDGSNDLWIKV